MSSKKKVEPLDLTEPTAEDVAALERARSYNRMDPQEYLRFLEQFTRGVQPSREIPPFHEPFKL